MSGKFRKAPTPPSRGGSLGKSTPPRVMPKITPKAPPAAANRPSNLQRDEQRAARREAARQQATKIQPRSRPTVRPSSGPLKQMPRVQTPPATQLNQAAKRPVVRPTVPPAGPPKSLHRPTAQPVQPPAGPPKSMRRPTPAPAARAAAGIAGAAAAGVALMALRTSAAHPDLSSGVLSLQSTLTDLQNRSDFSGIATDITNLDGMLNNVLNLLESARDKGYVYQGDMEAIAYQALDSWQSVSDQVDRSINLKGQNMQATLAGLNPHLQRLNLTLGNATTGAPALSTAQTQVNQVLWDLEKVEREITSSYSQIETNIRSLNSRLTTIHWALDQLGQAKFTLANQEDLIMAVPARWDKEGKEDPEGILYLSNKRLIFERKEKVATKKVLFVTTSSELQQEVLIAQTLDTIQSLKAISKGLFGHQDFMEVTFSDAKLGQVALHLNGQDSKHWVNLIERAKSGAIEDERASGSGLSFRDLTGDLTASDLMAIQGKVNQLQDEMMLKAVRIELTELENDLKLLERSLVGLRARGYAVEKSLEADIRVLTDQWDRIKGRAEGTLESQSQLLSGQMATIQQSLVALMALSNNLTAARPKFIALKSAIASAEAQAVAAEDTVLDQFDEYADEVEGLAAHLEWVGWMLEALTSASFRLLATESGVAATEAVWLRPGLEPENGILFLTDQRLLWEDRVGDFELKIAVPLSQVTGVIEQTDEQAEFEILAVSFESGAAPVAVAHLQLALPVADDWIKMINRARAGDYSQDRAVELDPAELDRIRNAPQQCANCGAAFTAPVLRGQTEISCEYCGVVARI